jgi:hypothetical protein
MMSDKITESALEKFTVELLEKAGSISSGFTRFMAWKTAGGKGDPAMDVKDEVAFFQAVKARLITGRWISTSKANGKSSG